MKKINIYLIVFMCLSVSVFTVDSNADMMGGGGDMIGGGSGGHMGSIRHAGRTGSSSQGDQLSGAYDWMTKGRTATGVKEGTEIQLDGDSIVIARSNTMMPEGYKEKPQGDVKMKTAAGPVDVAGSKYGDIEEVVWGPYGGLILVKLPQDARSFDYMGKKFYYSNFRYFRPFQWEGKWYYAPVPPPYGSVFYTLPKGTSTLTLDGEQYYIHDYAFLKETYFQGKLNYEVVPAPEGAKMFLLPTDSANVTVKGKTYHYYHDTFYMEKTQDGQSIYVVMPEPAGLTFINKLPENISLDAKHGITYIVSNSKYYLPYRQPDGADGFIVVDKPGDDKVAAAGDGIVVPSGTPLSIRLASALDTRTSKKGDLFIGYLDHEIAIDGNVAFPKGTVVAGKITDVKNAGVFGKSRLALEIIYLKLGEKIASVRTETLKLDMDDAEKIKKTEGALPLQTLIDGTGQTSGEDENNIVLPNQTLLDFTLIKHLTI